MALKSLANRRSKLINSSEVKLKKNASKAQRVLFEKILDALIDQLDISKGVIALDGRTGVKITTAINKVVEEFNKSTNLEIIGSMVEDLDVLADFSNSYFRDPGILGKSKALTEALGTAKSQTNGFLGLTSEGKLINNGTLSSLLNDSSIELEIKQLASTSVQSGSLTKLRSDIKGLIQGSPDKLGLVESHYDRFAKDTFAVFDRSYNNIIADEVGLDHALYQGGLVADSRDFCIERDGLVWTREEIASWADLSFQGKPDSYDPFIDLGGFNCRHSLNWISETLALQLRPDLAEAA